jgi:hypothetical protein
VSILGLSAVGYWRTAVRALMLAYSLCQDFAFQNVCRLLAVNRR